MDLNEAQNTFAIRLYRWSFNDFVREMAAGCPLMSLVGLNNRTVAAFVSWAKTMSPVEQQAFARARTRYAHENAADLCGEALSHEDQKELNEKFAQQMQIRSHQLPALITADERLPAFKAIDPDQCLDTLRMSLSPILGKSSRRASSVRCLRKIHDWKISTEFIFLRRDRDLRFEYQFVRKDGAPIIGHDSPFPRTLFLFYGVYATSVIVPSQADSEPMAKAMARLAEHFVAQADPLFEGLGVND